MPFVGKILIFSIDSLEKLVRSSDLSITNLNGTECSHQKVTSMAIFIGNIGHKTKLTQGFEIDNIFIYLMSDE